MAPTSSSKQLDLPAVSFSMLPVDQHDPPSLAHQPQFLPFGYNDGREWHAYRECAHSAHEGGGRYLRWLQPLESELAKQVEYDMDEHDKVWLDTLNADRKKEALPPIAYEVFEIIMDKLEKEWFDLTKSIPKKSNAIPSENEKCAICDDGECENSNAIVFCDGCNLAVHQDCYGVPYIPEGQWLCRKCTVSPDKPVDCVFCPYRFGAFKQTTTGHWGHLLCAIWIPETGVSNTVYMEPIDGVENVPKSRWKLNCYLCKKKLGACIQCSNRNCYTAYHVTCAREFGLEVRMKQPGTNSSGPGGDLKSYCDKHGQVQWEQFSQSRAAVPSSTRIPAIPHPGLQPHFSHPALPPLASTSSLPPPLKASTSSHVLPLASSKSLRSKKTHLSPIKQTPLIPNYISERIMAYIARIKGLTGKKEVLSSVCRYWSLKREGRRGAPLLKRIHLEPWTASATSRLQSDSDRAAKLELIKLLRTDLEKVRILTEQVRKREKKKLERLNWIKRSVLDEFVWAKETRLKEALKEIIAWDRQQYFLNAVDPELVPDYHDIITTPMHWSEMQTKLDRHEYTTAQQFANDAMLVMNNAQQYNKPSSPIHRQAVKILEKLEPLLSALVKDLDDPNSAVSTRERLAPQLLLEVLPEEQEEKGEDRQGVAVVDEFDRIWYDVEDPFGDKQEREEEAERERVRIAQAEQEARDKAEKEQEERKLEQERIERHQLERAEKVERSRQKERDRKARKREEDKLKKEKELQARIRRKEAKAKAKAEAAEAEGGKEKETKDEAENVEPMIQEGTAETRGGTKRKAVDPLVENSKTAKAQILAKKAKIEKDGSGSATTASSKPDATAQPDEDLSAEASISNRDSFKLFETGWVLPEGASRRKPVTPATTTIALPETATPVASNSQTSKPVPAAKAAPAKPKSAAPASSASDLKASPSKGSVPLREWQAAIAKFADRVAVTDETDLSDGVLVWHRFGGGSHPFYPAEIADPDGPDMPKSLAAARPKTAALRVPLLYFDETRSGAWALRSELKLLGEDKEFDRLMINPLAVRFYAKSKKPKPQKYFEDYGERLAEAYEFAMSVVEVDGDTTTSKKKRAPAKAKVKKAITSKAKAK